MWLPVEENVIGAGLEGGWRVWAGVGGVTLGGISCVKRTTGAVHPVAETTATATTQVPGIGNKCSFGIDHVKKIGKQNVASLEQNWRCRNLQVKEFGFEFVK